MSDECKCGFDHWPLPCKDEKLPNESAAYRMLKEGETIRDNDEFLDTEGVWRKTTCAGQQAPNPEFTSHRQYRRSDTVNH